MFRSGVMVFQAMIALTLAAAPSYCQSSQNPKVCGLLPIPELEAHFGGKATKPRGSDGQALSQCTVTINGRLVKIQSAPPGTPGLPTTVQQGLKAIDAIATDAKLGGKSVPTESRDFGSVGCGTQTLTGLQGMKSSFYSTTCFRFQGGYLSLILASEDSRQVSFEVVKDFLEKAAARRK